MSITIRQQPAVVMQWYEVLIPVASGKIGDYLAFAKESVDRSHIEQIALVRVDGESILPDVWYDVNLNERNEIL